MSRKFLLCAALAVLAAGVILWHFWPASGDASHVLSGNVEIRQAALSFRQGGRIAELLVDEGHAVKKGDVLARLDRDVLKASLERAAAEAARQDADLRRMHAGFRSEEVAQAESGRSAAQAQEENAAIQLHRIQAMRSRNAISQKELDNAEAAARTARANLASASELLDLKRHGYRQEEIDAQEAATAAARASRDLAAIALDDAELRAPSDGVILTRAAEAGSVVAAGQTVLTLTLTDPVWLRVYAPEPLLGRIQPGQACRVFTDSAPEKALSGRIGFISPSAEFTPKTVETEEVRTSLVYRIRVLADDPDGILRQGMPVRVVLDTAAD